MARWRVVLCADERGQIQALSRSADPVLPADAGSPSADDARLCPQQHEQPARRARPGLDIDRPLLAAPPPRRVSRFLKPIDTSVPQDTRVSMSRDLPRDGPQTFHNRLFGQRPGRQIRCIHSVGAKRLVRRKDSSGEASGRKNRGSLDGAPTVDTMLRLTQFTGVPVVRAQLSRRQLCSAASARHADGAPFPLAVGASKSRVSDTTCR